MKLLSTRRDTFGSQLICKNTVFDPSLISIKSIDATEKVITFKYDFNECGHPLNLPFDASNVVFLAKLTSCDIHICVVADLDDDNNKYNDFSNDLGSVEFDVRLSLTEKFSLLLHMFLALFCETANDTTKR